MASVGNGTANWSLTPRPSVGTNQEGTFSEVSNYLLSANSPIRYQVLYERTTSAMTADEPPEERDVVNVIFTIYGTSVPYPSSPTSQWEKVATIRKSRDIAYLTLGGIHAYAAPEYIKGHRFTIDISSICSDLLSYSLVPVGKGTFAYDTMGSPGNIVGYRGTWGGMNGDGHPPDNVLTSSNTKFHLTQNGAYRHIKIHAGFELLQADGTVSIAATTAGQSIEITDENWITVINSVPQWEEDAVYYSGGAWNNSTRYYFDRWGNDTYSFLTKCPNFSDSSTPTTTKDVRVTDEAEWLYFWLYRIYANYTWNPTILTNFGDRTMLEVRMDTGTLIYLDDFQNLLKYPLQTNITQAVYCAQNVSPNFIENNAKTAGGSAIGFSFDSPTVIESYSVRYVNRTAVGQAIIGMSQFRHFKIDRETEHPFGYVRFHWLNRMGGIDSYTAKRDVVESVSVEKSTFESKSPDKLWLQRSEIILFDDSVRGDLYRGGREVLNVSANRNHSVFTEPLNKSTAKWLEELITSPNVWIEHESEATKRRNTVNGNLRPSTKTYIPIVITNSDVETVNQESGLVKFNIEFTHSHSINTQRN